MKKIAGTHRSHSSAPKGTNFRKNKAPEGLKNHATFSAKSKTHKLPKG